MVAGPFWLIIMYLAMMAILLCMLSALSGPQSTSEASMRLSMSTAAWPAKWLRVACNLR